MKTVDGFPVTNAINFLPEINADINEWSKDKNIKITVADAYLNPATVSWKGKQIWVGDFEFFVMLVTDWMKRYKQTKEEVLDEIFDMV